MNKLTDRVRTIRTEILIDMFKELEKNLSEHADLVNDAVMNELALRLPEDKYNALIDEVYGF